jgi:hypothetical protein
MSDLLILQRKDSPPNTNRIELIVIFKNNSSQSTLSLNYVSEKPQYEIV